jgi:hypothetical protein
MMIHELISWISANPTFRGCMVFPKLPNKLPVLDALHLGVSTTSDELSGLLPDSRPTKNTFYSQDDPLIWEEVLDSRLGGSVPRVLRFSLRIFRDEIDRTLDWPSAWIYDST